MKRSLHIMLLLLACLAVAVAGVELEFDFDDPENADALPSAVVKGAEEAHRYNVQGLDALEAGDLDAALSLFEEALEAHPGYVDAENNIGVVYFRKGILYEARERWEKIVKREPRYAIAQHNLGVLSFHSRDYDRAREYFRKALRQNRRLAEARVMLGRVALQEETVEEALDHLIQAYKVDPDNPDASNFYAFGLMQVGDTAKAKAILEKPPHNAEALRMLGMIAALRKQYQQAADYLSAAVERGGPPELLVNMASAQLDNANYQAARASIKRYMALSGAVPVADAYLLGGIAAKQSGNLDEARQLFEEGLQRYPRDPILRYNLGQICFQQQDFASAEQVWETLADTLQDPSLYYLRALNALRTGNVEQAEILAGKAIEIDGKAEYYDLLGVALYRQGEKKTAIAKFKKALRLEPNLRSAQLNLALTQQSPEDLKSGIADLERRLKDCTEKCAAFSFQLSVLNYHLKDYKAAIEALLAVPEEQRDQRIYRHLALYYRQLHEWDKSIAMLEHARQRFVLEPQTEYELAETYLLAAHYAKAIEVFTDLVGKWEENPWRLYYQMGYAYMEMNDLGRARSFFEKSLRAKPDNVAARGLLAFVHNRQGDAATARKLWERNLKDDPQNPVLLINMGLSLEREGNYHKALEYYKKAAMMHGDDKALHINIGNAYTGLERFTDAFHAYSLALDSPKRKLAAFNSFLAAAKAKKRTKARSMLEILTTEFPSSGNTLRAKSEVALWEGDTAKALRSLRRIDNKDPNDWLAMGRVYAARGKERKARECLSEIPPRDTLWHRARTDLEAQIAYHSGNCSRAISLWESLDDTSFSARYNVALAALRCKDYGRAAAIGERLISKAKGKDRADVCRLVGNAAFGLEQWHKAKQWYLQLSNVEARDPVVQYNLAVASYNLDEIDRAWGYYRKARKLDPTLSNKDIEKRYHATHKDAKDSVVMIDSADTWYNSAVNAQEAGELEKAQQLYRKVIGSEPHHIHAWNNLGAIYAAEGELEEAEECYRKALRKQHDLPEAYANLVNLYIAMGDFKQAKRWTVKGRGHNPDSELLREIEQMLDDSLSAQ